MNKTLKVILSQLVFMIVFSAIVLLFLSRIIDASWSNEGRHISAILWLGTAGYILLALNILMLYVRLKKLDKQRKR